MGVRRVLCSMAILGTGRMTVPSTTTVAEDAYPELPEIHLDDDVPPEVPAGTLPSLLEMGDMGLVDTPECHERCPKFHESRTAFKKWCLAKKHHWCMEQCGHSYLEWSCGDVMEL